MNAFHRLDLGATGPECGALREENSAHRRQRIVVTMIRAIWFCAELFKVGVEINFPALVRHNPYGGISWVVRNMETRRKIRCQVGPRMLQFFEGAKQCRHVAIQRTQPGDGAVEIEL